MTKTYAQITREIQALQASAEKMRAAEIKAVIAKINESIGTYGLTASDLRFPAASSSSTKPASSSRHAPVSGDVKYSDEQGNVWGGRGPRPAWLRQAIAQGRSPEDFAVSGPAPGAGTSRPSSNGNKATSKLPPLYGHAKTGQTWSGRGPRPAWLKQALKKRGASIEDFLISARNSAPADASAVHRSSGSATSANPKTGSKPEAAKTAIGRKVSTKKSEASNGASSSSKTRNSPAASANQQGTARKTAAGKSATATAGNATGAGGKGRIKPSVHAAKKVITPAGAKTAAKTGADKSQARKPARPRQQVASSMAPSSAVEAASPASFTPAAAPLPAGGSVTPAEQDTGSST